MPLRVRGHERGYRTRQLAGGPGVGSGVGAGMPPSRRLTLPNQLAPSPPHPPSQHHPQTEWLQDVVTNSLLLLSAVKGMRSDSLLSPAEQVQSLCMALMPFLGTWVLPCMWPRHYAQHRNLW